MQIYNEEGQKRLLILCKETQAAKDHQLLKKCKSKDKKDKDKKQVDKKDRDKDKNEDAVRSQQKTKEELVRERDQHIENGVKEFGIGVAATIGAMTAPGSGPMGLAAGCVAAYEIKEAANEITKAGECQDQINEIEQKSEAENEN